MVFEYHQDKIQVTHPDGVDELTIALGLDPNVHLAASIQDVSGEFLDTGSHWQPSYCSAVNLTH